MSKEVIHGKGIYPDDITQQWNYYRASILSFPLPGYYTGTCIQEVIKMCTNHFFLHRAYMYPYRMVLYAAHVCVGRIVLCVGGDCSNNWSPADIDRSKTNYMD